MILNTVDCTRPNGGRLPQNVDLMMSDFAGGASGFPMTFCGGKYTGEAHFSGQGFHLTAHCHLNPLVASSFEFKFNKWVYHHGPFIFTFNWNQQKIKLETNVSLRFGVKYILKSLQLSLQTHPHLTGFNLHSLTLSFIVREHYRHSVLHLFYYIMYIWLLLISQM